MSNLTHGAVPSKVDLRDYQIKPGTISVDEFSLDSLPAVKNQSIVGSCVAHALSSILEWFNQKETGEVYELSTGFIYGMQGIEFSRSKPGMYVRDACKIAQKYGDCLFSTFPYNIEMPSCYKLLSEKQNEKMLREAGISKIKSYAKCSTADSVKHALINHGPVLASIKWYDEYELTDDASIEFDTSSASGYHVVMVYGFNRKGWLCQNSWGRLWGNRGRFILPFNYDFSEAWSFVDENNGDVYRPKRGKLIDFAYKIANHIINIAQVGVDWLRKRIGLTE